MDTQRAAKMDTSDSPVHLISWNVASWKPTLDKIDKLCGGLEVGGRLIRVHAPRIPRAWRPWKVWLERLNVDILALQEVKLTTREVSDDPGPRALGATVANYDTCALTLVATC